MTSTDPILVSRTEAVATVTLNRPARLNALDRNAWQRLAATFAEISADESVRCVVVRGAGGKAFGAGADISAFEHERANVEQAAAYGADMESALKSIADGHPSIALIEGLCVGGGLELACACDLRVCGGSSRFGVPVNHLGLTMAYGELRALLSVVSPSVAKEILLSGELFDASWALRVGLVHRVVDDERVAEATYELADRVASGAPRVNAWHKEFIARLADPTPLTAAEEAEGFAAFGTKDFQRGYRAFLEKREPEFEGD